MKRKNKKPSEMVAHSDIDQTRKQEVGHLLD